MFYSHEILSNSQHGVATIWLIATVGKAKRVSRKAIQDVNVPKACETIIDPGAPLALRLQGNLLYGVSRVFSQQCGYVLSDAEKTQSDMMTFFRVMQTSETDPQAGKAKRHQITLQDDPNFDPLSTLPSLDLFNNAADLTFLSSQTSTQRVSQMTPLKSLSQSQGTISPDHNAPLFGIGLPPSSSHSANSYRLPSNFGIDSPFPKLRTELDGAEALRPFGLEDELDPIVDIGLNFDADGNIIEAVQPEPELPPLPGPTVPEMHGALLMGSDIDKPIDEQVRGRMNLLGDDNVIILGEDALPNAEPFPTSKKKRLYDPAPTSESTQSQTATAPAKRGRPRRKACSMVDEQDHVGRQEFRGWTENYIENMDAMRKRRRVTTQAQARKNAMALIFDNGVANIGITEILTGVAHPLAEDFSGGSLRARLSGQLVEDVQEPEKRRGRRRSSSEAFEDEEEEQRRVRQKAQEESEIAQGAGDLGDLILGDDMAPEMGMGAVQGMEDLHSSMMPWSRPPSAIPGSSIRGSAQKLMPAPSPLLGRGSVVKSIERHSDLPGLAQDSDDLAQLYSQDSSITFGGPVGPLDFTRGEDTQTSSAGLDIASQEFLGYATYQAQEKGLVRARDRQNRRWIDFEQVASPDTHNKAVAAQAFMHVLSLATKNAIAVEQDGIQEQEPFGTIRIGLTVSQDDSVDELA